MGTRHEELYWLVEPPENFREQAKSLENCKGPLGNALRALAGSRLNTNQLTSLSSVLKRVQASGADLSPLSGFKLGVIGNATTSLFVGALPAAAARHGINLSIVEAEYDQVMQEAINPQSLINQSGADAILLTLDYRGLPFSSGMSLEAAIDYVSQVRGALAQGSSAPVIFQTLVCPPAPRFGSLDMAIDNTHRYQINALNQSMLGLAKERGDYILDIASVAEMVGTQNWQDPAQWNLYKLPFAQNMLPVYVEHLARLLSAIRGLSKKCLVLDLDNTVWGGVIGDDGFNGIKIGQGDAAGEAHVEIQKMALALRDRGVILAVSSKNDDHVARQPFKEHPDMVLREDHITVFQANWRDKASNLEAIAKTLNIGLDALVMLDDNPAERAQIRKELPMVGVPELPDDVSLYPRTLLNAGYFEAVNFSEEDKQRAEQYRQNAQRAELEANVRNMDEFLDSLEMKIEIGAVTDFNVARVAQLINKTNQFNLTTKRYTQGEVEAMMKDENIITLQARLIDRFGDNGLISVGLARVQGKVCDIDTWLMSCRVLGRRVEEAMLAEFVKLASERGATELRGRYIPTAKNSMVAEHYKKLGFESVGTEGHDTLWSLKIADFGNPELPFERVQLAA